MKGLVVLNNLIEGLVRRGKINDGDYIFVVDVITHGVEEFLPDREIMALIPPKKGGIKVVRMDDQSVVITNSARPTKDLAADLWQHDTLIGEDGWLYDINAELAIEPGYFANVYRSAIFRNVPTLSLIRKAGVDEFDIQNALAEYRDWQPEALIDMFWDAWNIFIPELRKKEGKVVNLTFLEHIL